MTTPVLLPSGELENFTIKVAGHRFRCSCGCNVFHKPDASKPEIYQCNACDAHYDSEQ